MLKIELVPDLNHCIETVTRMEYEETLKQLLAAGERSEQLEERLELLRVLLKTIDFKQLRQKSEKFLVEGKKVKFVFYLKEGVPKYGLRVT